MRRLQGEKLHHVGSAAMAPGGRRHGAAVDLHPERPEQDQSRRPPHREPDDIREDDAREAMDARSAQLASSSTLAVPGAARGLVMSSTDGPFGVGAPFRSRPECNIEDGGAMVGSSGGVQYGTPDRGKDSVFREARGRLCAEPSCMTVLSTYNRSATCYLHTAPSYRHPLQRP
jgi:hypothetical protein